MPQNALGSWWFLEITTYLHAGVSDIRVRSLEALTPTLLRIDGVPRLTSVIDDRDNRPPGRPATTQCDGSRPDSAAFQHVRQ